MTSPALDRFAMVADLPGVPEVVAEVSSALDRLAKRRALQLDPGQVRAELSVRAAKASATLAGVEIDLGLLREDKLEGSPAAPVVRGALRISAELATLAPIFGKAPLQAFARLHTLAAAEGIDAEDLGRPRSEEAAARLEVLADLLVAESVASPLVVAAVVHAEILHSEAFGDASGLVARAAARLVLITRGTDPHGILALEIGHAALGLTQYQKALELYGTGGAHGLAAWCRHCAQAVEVTTTEASQVAMVVRPGVRSSAYGRQTET